MSEDGEFIKEEAQKMLNELNLTREEFIERFVFKPEQCIKPKNWKLTSIIQPWEIWSNRDLNFDE